MPAALFEGNQGADTPKPSRDSRLDEFFNATSERHADRALTRLTATVIRPKATAVVRKHVGNTGGFNGSARFAAADADDLIQDAVVKTIERLAATKKNEDLLPPILNIEKFVHTVAARVCIGDLREVHKRRKSLQDQLRYILTHRAGFKLWRAEGDTLVAGFAVWEFDAVPADRSRQIVLFANDVEKLDKLSFLDKIRSLFSSSETKKQDEMTALIGLVEFFLNKSRAPIPFDDLVSAVVTSLGLPELSIEEMPVDENGNAVFEPADPENFEQALLDRAYISMIWKALDRVVLDQRRAFLLQASDEKGQSICFLAVMTRVTTIVALAILLDYEFDLFAIIWPKLALEDNEIAVMMGVERQRVIDLRRFARRLIIRHAASLDEM
jgi:DNA-directed RNA polymerase specialized sigma24 family protein